VLCIIFCFPYLLWSLHLETSVMLFAAVLLQEKQGKKEKKREKTSLESEKKYKRQGYLCYGVTDIRKEQPGGLFLFTIHQTVKNKK